MTEQLRTDVAPQARLDGPALALPPARRSVAVHATYAEAERAVDALSDAGFPVERVALVGQDLQTVEQITGRLDYGGAAWRGLAGGAVTGALLGWVFGLFAWIDPLVAGIVLAFYGLLAGAVIGLLTGLLVHALQGGRRDFSSVSAIRPTRYEVLVDSEVADRAAALLRAT